MSLMTAATLLFVGALCTVFIGPATMIGGGVLVAMEKEVAGFVTIGLGMLLFLGGMVMDYAGFIFGGLTLIKQLIGA